MLPEGFHARILPTTNIAACCDLNSSRYALAAVEALPVLGETEQVWLAATDGRCAAVTQAAGELEPGLACVLVPAKLAGLPRKKADAKTPAMLNGRWERGDKLADPVEGFFPRLHDVLPPADKDNTLAVRFDVRMLAKVAEAISTDGVVTLFIRHDGADNSASCPLAIGGEAGIGVLMPCGPTDGLDPRAPERNRYQAMRQAYVAAKLPPAKPAAPAKPKRTRKPRGKKS